MTTTLDAIKQFIETPLETVLQQHLKNSAQAHITQLADTVYAEVLAYQHFLKEQGLHFKPPCDPTLFEQLPAVTKNNYLRVYPLDQLCRSQDLAANDMIAASSGSTGEAMFWPRHSVHELDIARRFEHIFVGAFKADQRKTLAVVCFALGNWVGGIYSANCIRTLQLKDYPITMVTPGSNPAEIFRCVEKLAPYFDQTVLLGYPPFIKDVIDQGIERGLDWQTMQLKFVLAGEVFSEEWRSLVAERAGNIEVYSSFSSLYGTADAGVLGNETPLSIAIRRFLSQNPEATRTLFGESRLPTLVQYDPMSRYFETLGDTLMVSGDNGVPLLRYHIADKGGLISFAEMMAFIKDHHFDLNSLNLDLALDMAAQLPFAYIFGRSDFTVSYFGANIYPENITVGLEQTQVHRSVSGKFVLEVITLEDQDKRLAIAVELRPGIEANDALHEAVAESVLFHLKRLNSEFTHYVPAVKQAPIITLKPHGDPEYFPPGVKHRYTRKTM